MIRIDIWEEFWVNGNSLFVCCLKICLRRCEMKKTWLNWIVKIVFGTVMTVAGASAVKIL